MRVSKGGGVRLLMALLVAVITCAVAVPVAATGAGKGDTAKHSKKKKKKKKKKKETGGPVAIAGIDAEDGGPGGHGPITDFQAFTNSVLFKVKKSGGSGILVIGGGKDPTDSITSFWNAIGSGTGQPITYANGAGIATANFNAARMIAVASSEAQASGGLTQLEQDALNARAKDVSDFIDNGGGLQAYTQDGLLNPYAYIAGIGAVTSIQGGDYSLIAPTADGAAVGLTTAITGPWHETYVTFPAFLKVLATDAEVGDPQFGQVAALGGDTVITTPEPKPKPKKKKKKKKKKKPTFTG